MALHGQLVVGVYLYGEVLARVDELDEQRKLVAILLIHLLTDEQTLVLVDELGEVQTHVDIVDEAALHSHTLMTRHAADLPTFADIRLGGIDALERCNTIATPDGGLQIGFELIRFHILSFFHYSFLISQCPSLRPKRPAQRHYCRRDH